MVTAAMDEIEALERQLRLAGYQPPDTRVLMQEDAPDPHPVCWTDARGHTKLSIISSTIWRDEKWVHLPSFTADDLFGEWSFNGDLLGKRPSWFVGEFIYASHHNVNQEGSWIYASIGMARVDERAEDPPFGIGLLWAPQPDMPHHDILGYPLVVGRQNSEIDPWVGRNWEKRLVLITGSQGNDITMRYLSDAGLALANQPPLSLLRPDPNHELLDMVEAPELICIDDKWGLSVSVGNAFGNGPEDRGYRQFGTYAQYFFPIPDPTVKLEHSRPLIDIRTGRRWFEGNLRAKNPGNGVLFFWEREWYFVHHLMDRLNPYYPHFPGRVNYNQRFPAATKARVVDGQPYIDGGLFPEEWRKLVKNFRLHERFAGQA